MRISVGETRTGAHSTVLDLCAHGRRPGKYPPISPAKGKVGSSEQNPGLWLSVWQSLFEPSRDRPLRLSCTP